MLRETNIFKYLLYGNKLLSIYYQPKIKKHNGGVIEKTIDQKFANCNIKFKDSKIDIIVYQWRTTTIIRTFFRDMLI